MNFQRVNNITGWIVCAMACTVYLMTMEASASLWDCGEFISSAFKMQVPHPPGAPLFVLLGRLFIVVFGGSNPAIGVNIMSALSSGFTILFLFWTITHFAKKIVLKNTQAQATSAQLLAIMAAGAVGALAYTFSDSFWFSAVEGEVYAMSSLFTALVFWAILKWENAVTAEQKEGKTTNKTSAADKWIVFIFFMMGLSIGVHLLNLLTIPAIVMVIYFKRYNPTKAGTFWAFLIGCVITGFVQKFVIQYTVVGAGKFDILFVNNLGLPFFTGFTFFFVVLAALFYFLLKFAIKKNWPFLRLGVWCIVFMLIGYSTYLTTMIRSNANPSVDMYNVDNPMSLVGYLGREQYGDFPLLYGQVFTAEATGSTDKTTYAKVGDKYVETKNGVEIEYAPDDMMIFPRVWDASNDQGHAKFYQSWLGLADGEKPSLGDNLSFFFGYQVNWMYGRYFMWNFAGKQNDIQGFSPGNVRDGNWVSGIGFIDNARLGNQSTMPESIKKNKAHNTLYFLPLIVGLMGLVFQYQSSKKDFIITGLLFFFTGFAIVLYLNQAGNQPRERDYAYVGSFYAFAIWIGLGVLQAAEWLKKWLGGLPATVAATGLCLLAVPVLMAQQEWDDHDRSKKVLAKDLAKNYLESCAPNAILFTYGDNDTYPLWYAQEVEGIRPDVRVINNSLLGIDWYINQLRYKVNESAPIDVIWNADQIQGRNRDYVFVNPRKELDPNAYLDLYNTMKDFVGSEDPNAKVPTQGGETLNYFPALKFKVPVDEATVRSNGTINPTDSAVADLLIEINEKRNVIMKNDLAILNIIAANKWKRPIYFTAPNTGSELGFGQYLRRDGLTYRLVPIKNNTGVNIDWMTDKLAHKFGFASADIKGVYFDEQNRLNLNSIRQSYGVAAAALAEANKKEEAKKILDIADKNILAENFPYAMVSGDNRHNYFTMQFFLEACYKADYKELAQKISTALSKDFKQQTAYYEQLPESKKEGMQQEIQGTQQLIQMLTAMESHYKRTAPNASPELPNKLLQSKPPDSSSGDSGKKTNKK
jgi:hypothetical protein